MDCILAMPTVSSPEVMVILSLPAPESIIGVLAVFSSVFTKVTVMSFCPAPALIVPLFKLVMVMLSAPSAVFKVPPLMVVMVIFSASDVP